MGKNGRGAHLHKKQKTDGGGPADVPACHPRSSSKAASEYSLGSSLIAYDGDLPLRDGFQTSRNIQADGKFIVVTSSISKVDGKPQYRVQASSQR
jgi:hypothetical protein